MDNCSDHIFFGKYLMNGVGAFIISIAASYSIHWRLYKCVYFNMILRLIRLWFFSFKFRCFFLELWELGILTNASTYAHEHKRYIVQSIDCCLATGIFLPPSFIVRYNSYFPLCVRTIHLLTTCNAIRKWHWFLLYHSFRVGRKDRNEHLRAAKIGASFFHITKANRLVPL